VKGPISDNHEASQNLVEYLQPRFLFNRPLTFFDFIYQRFHKQSPEQKNRVYNFSYLKIELYLRSFGRDFSFCFGETEKKGRCDMKKEILFLCIFILTGSAGNIWEIRGASATVSEGEAKAVFNAGINGGGAIHLHSPQMQGAPSKGGLSSNVATRPFCFFEGRHYCETDWHVLLIAYIDGPAPDGCPNLTVGDVRKEMSTLQITFFLDGEDIDSERTPLKAAVGPDKGWGIEQGSLFAPGDLSVGPHTFSVVTTGSTYDPADGCTQLEPFTDNLPFAIEGVCDTAPPYVTFYIDAAGTGACIE
jgi:hypothetical protein